MWEYKNELFENSNILFQSPTSHQNNILNPIQKSWNTANGLFTTYRSILIWTFINLYFWPFLIPNIVLITKWMKLLHQINHLDIIEFKDDQIDAIINRISNIVGSLTIFSIIIFLIKFQFLQNIAEIESMWVLWLMFLCCGLPWSVIAYREIDSIVEIMSDIYPYYYPNFPNLSDHLKKIRNTLLLICLPIINLFGALIYIKRTWLVFSIYHQDWLRTKNSSTSNTKLI